MAIDPNVRIPTPVRAPAPRTPDAQTQQPAKKEEPDFLSSFKADKALAKPQNRSFQNFGDEGKRAQAIAFNAGMYPSRDVSSPQALQASFDKEVDGKVGARTHQAFTATQELMKKAGFYNGPVNGQFNAEMAKGLDKLRKTEQLPTTGLNAEEQQKLGRLAAAASQKAPAPIPPAKGEDTFSRNATQAPNGAPNIDGQPKQVDGSRVLDNLTRLVGNKADPAGTIGGPERTEKTALETMKLAAKDPKLTDAQNDAQLMARVKALGTPEQLGFDPAKQSADSLRTLLNGHASELMTQANAQNAEGIKKVLQHAATVSPMIQDPGRQKEMIDGRLKTLASNPDQVRQLTGMPGLSDDRARAYVAAAQRSVSSVLSGVGPKLNLPPIAPPAPYKMQPAAQPSLAEQAGINDIKVPQKKPVTVPSSPWTLGAD
jgi:hypothetical protein